MFETKENAAPLPALAFPKGFSWGVSTASYQIEGAVAEGGRGPSIWDTFCDTPGRIRHGDTGVIACDHYHRLDEDLDLLKKLDVDVYRFSIAWPRVQPLGKGGANAEGVDFYSRLVDGLLARGITPVPTLYHWDLPQALVDAGEDWPARAIVGRFTDYAELMFKALGDRVPMWTTFNEPWASAYLGYDLGVHAPGIADPRIAAAAHHHLLLAHGDTVAACRALCPDAKIGIALNLMECYAATQDPADVAAAKLADDQLNASFIDPLVGRAYPTSLHDFFADGAGIVEPGDMQRIAQPIDFISINNYHPRWLVAPENVAKVRADGFDGGYSDALSFRLAFRDVMPAQVDKTMMGWPIEAQGLTDLIKRVGGDFDGIAVYISENGFAGSDYTDQAGAVNDEERVAYLDAHLRACHAAIEAGVDLRGYWQWSFLDNFEWSFGYGMRFGLVYVDYPTRNRTPKASYHWYGDVVRANGLSAR